MMKELSKSDSEKTYKIRLRRIYIFDLGPRNEGLPYEIKPLPMI